MADITMCTGEGCPLAKTCYRHNAPSSMMQSFFMEAPYDSDEESCQYYWKDNYIKKETDGTDEVD